MVVVHDNLIKYGVPLRTKFKLSHFDVEHVIVIFKHAMLLFAV